MRSGRIAKLSAMSSTGLTTLQKEILRLVVIIASLATLVAVIIVILWAAWSVRCSVSKESCDLTKCYRLRHDHPSYINVPVLLIDVVSVMGTPVSLFSLLLILKPFPISRIHS